MKNISTIQRLLVILMVVSFSSNVNGQYKFQKEYNTGPNSAVLIDTLSDGYLVVGTTNVQTVGLEKGFAMKIDFEGNPVWEKSYGGAIGNGVEEFRSMARTHDSHFILAGHTNTFVDTPGTLNIYLVEIDTLGSVIWSKSISTGYFAIGYSVKETIDHGIIIGGEAMTSDSDQMHAYLIKLDSMRNIEWSHVYADTLNDESRIHSVIQTSDGGYAFTGYATPTGLQDYNMMIVRTDSTGSVIRSTLYSYPPNLSYATLGVIGNDIIQNSSGNIVVVGGAGGFYIPASSDIYEWLLLEEDTSGTVINSKAFTLNTGDCKANSVQQSPDGGYILGGSMGNYYLAMLKTDTNIITDWCYHYDVAFNPIATGSCVRITRDQGFILSGSLVQPGNKIRIVKTQSDGTSGCAETVPIGPGGASGNISLPSVIVPWTSVSAADTVPAPTITTVKNITSNTICSNVGINDSPENDFLKIYPNPVRTMLSIDFNRSEKITICNLLGEIVIEADFSYKQNGRMELNIQGLVPGIYFLKAGNVVRKFLKE